MDKAQCRKEMGFTNDKFLIGMVAMNKGNPSRKAFNQTLAAFAAMKKKYKDVQLYLHTGDGLRGFEPVNLLEVCKALDLSYGYFAGPENNDKKDVIFANQYGLAMGYENQMMAKLFNSFDVYSGVTMGEGFGIPILEAQACGVPVIIGDWTSMSELYFSGWKVEREEAEPMFTPQNAWQYLPRAVAIAERMDAAYKMRGNPDYSKRAREGAKKYNAEKIISDMWLPILDKIEKKLKEGNTKALDKNLDVLR